MSESAQLAFREMTNLDLAVLIRESKQLVGLRIDKIYQAAPTEFVFRFKSKDLVVLIPYAIFTAEREAHEKEPTPFVMSLRKHLENKILESIEQPNLDRICMMKFGDMRLVLELFGKGNLVLIDGSDMITMLLRKEETRQRTIKTGGAYKLPEMKKLKPTKDNLEQILGKGEDEKAIVVLSRNINMPAVYMNELLQAADIDPKKNAKGLTPAEITRISGLLSAFFESVMGGRVSPVLRDDGSYFVADIGERGGKAFSSFSELLAEVHRKHKEEKKEEVREAGVERLLKKLKHQEDRVEDLKKEIEEEGKLGSMILENESIIRELTERLKVLRKEGKNWDEIERELSRIRPVKIEKGKIALEL